MKGVYDKRKIPRETLAYLIDSTGSPVCVLIPFSSWAVYFGSIFFLRTAYRLWAAPPGLRLM